MLLNVPAVFAQTPPPLTVENEVKAQSESEIKAVSKAEVKTVSETQVKAEAKANSKAKHQAEITQAREQLAGRKEKKTGLAKSLSEQLIAAADKRLAEYAALQHWLPYQAEFSAWLPAGAEHLAVCLQAVQLQTAQADAKPWGRISYVLQCQDQPGWMLRGRVTVAVSLPVWVAAEPLKREQTVSAELLTLQSMNIASLHRGFISSQHPPKRRMLRDLAVAQPLYPAILAPVWLVQKNEQVVIEAVGTDFTVSTQGLALSNGSKGELVAVQNLDSGKRIQARVVGKHKVQTLH